MKKEIIKIMEQDKIWDYYQIHDIDSFISWIFYKIGIKKSGLNLYFRSRKL